MSALDDLGITKKTIKEMTPIEFAIWNMYNDGYTDAEQAAEELARLRAFEQTARDDYGKIAEFIQLLPRKTRMKYFRAGRDMVPDLITFVAALATGGE